LPVHEAVGDDDARTLTPPTSHECSPYEVRDALRRLQQRFDLQPSGRLDDETKTFMSRGRCGNTDAELRRRAGGSETNAPRHSGTRGHRRKRSTDNEDLQPEPEIAAEETESMERQRKDSSDAKDYGAKAETGLSQAECKSRRKRSANEWSRKSNLETTLRQTGSYVQQQRTANTATMRRLSDVGSRKRQRRSAEVASSPVESPGIDYADLHSRLVAGTDHEPGAALARRTKMFIEIRKRHRLQLAAEALRGDSTTRRRNHTEEELAAIRRRIRHGRAQRDHRGMEDRRLTSGQGPILDQDPTSDQRRTLDQGPTSDQGPMPDQGPILDQDPTSDQRRTLDQKPTSDQGPMPDQGPTLDQGSTSNQGPTLDQGLTSDQETTSDQVPSPTTSAGGARRRRRSISVPSFDERVNEGPAADDDDDNERMRFQQNANSPVRWRLLADGVSGKIPLSDQRAILELAFRMWSEVIPLKFHESNGIDVVDMDVIIAFAKRQSLYNICCK